MSWNKSIILITSLLISSQLFAQKSVADYLNIDQLEKKEAIPIEKINSEEIDFAPALFRDGLLFINANTEKRRIRENEKIHFQLMFAKGDQIQGFEKAEIFDSISNKGEFDGPVCYIPGENMLVATKNQKAIFESDDRNEMRLGLYFYIFDGVEWKEFGEFPMNDKHFNVCHPAYDDESGRLIFASDMPGGFGGLDLYVVSRNKEGGWSTPQNLGPTINSTGNDCFPYLFEGDFLFFSSDRKSSLGGMDIYASMYADDQWLDGFSLPGNINSKWDDLGFIVGQDGRQLFFTSSRENGKGKDDLYGVYLDESLISVSPDFLSIKVFKDREGKTIAGAGIRFYKFRTQDVVIEKDQEEFSNIRMNIDPESIKGSKPVTTNDKGEAYISLKPGEYIMQTTKNNYRTDQQLVRIGEAGGLISVYMDSIECKELQLNIVDANENNKLQGAAISDGKDVELFSDKEGLAGLCIHRESPLSLIIRKDDYQDFGVHLEYDELTDGEMITISLRPEKIFTEELPVYSGEFTVLENILYDFDDFALNKAARQELDSLALHMGRYPSIRIELSAHTDSRGGEMYNQLLSEKRAKTAREYLVEKGVNADRVAASGYGESRLRNHCSDGVSCVESEHALNRRTEVRVLAASH